MPTPNDAPYKVKQRELERRRKTVWIPDPKLDHHIAADGAVYERTNKANGGRTLTKVGQLEPEQQKLERERRASAMAEYLGPTP
jgi:hypothetical protein